MGRCRVSWHGVVECKSDADCHVPSWRWIAGHEDLAAHSVCRHVSEHWEWIPGMSLIKGGGRGAIGWLMASQTVYVKKNT